jgi:putative DNA primase/helicase
LIDEADTFLKENDELRGILNTGHRRGGQVLRTVGDDHEPRQFSTWAPAAIAMIGRLPDTLHDRSVIINLRRRKPTEEVKSFRRDRADDLHVLARKMARWAQDHQVQLTASDPDMGELINRGADNWRHPSPTWLADPGRKGCGRCGCCRQRKHRAVRLGPAPAGHPLDFRWPA